MQFLNHLFVRPIVFFLILKKVIASEAEIYTSTYFYDIEKIAQDSESPSVIIIEDPSAETHLDKQSNIVLDQNKKNQNHNETIDLREQIKIDELKILEKETKVLIFLYEKLSKIHDFYSLLSLLQPEQGEFYEEVTRRIKLIDIEVSDKEIEMDKKNLMNENTENLQNTEIFNEIDKVHKIKLLEDLELRKSYLRSYILKLIQEFIVISDSEPRSNKKREFFENLVNEYFDQQKLKHQKIQKNHIKNGKKLTKKINQIFNNIYGKIDLIEEIERKDNYIREDIENIKLKIYLTSLEIHLIEDKISELEEFNIEEPNLNLYRNIDLIDLNGLSFDLKLELYKTFVLKMFKKNDYIKIELKKLNMKLKNRNLMLKRLICFNGLLNQYHERIKDYDHKKKHKGKLTSNYIGCKCFGSNLFEETTTNKNHLEFLINEYEKEKELNNENILMLLSDIERQNIFIGKNDQMMKKNDSFSDLSTKNQKDLLSEKSKTDEIFVSKFEIKLNHKNKEDKISQPNKNLPSVAISSSKINELNDELESLDKLKVSQQIQNYRSDFNLMNTKIKEIINDLKVSDFNASFEDEKKEINENNQIFSLNTFENQEKTNKEKIKSSEEIIFIDSDFETSINLNDQNNFKIFPIEDQNSSFFKCKEGINPIQSVKEVVTEKLHDQNFEKNFDGDDAFNFENPLI